MNLQQNAAIKMQQQNSQENKSPGEGNSAPNDSGNSERFLFDFFSHTWNLHDYEHFLFLPFVAQFVHLFMC